MALSFLPRVIVFCHNVPKEGNVVGGEHEKQEWPTRRRQDESRHKKDQIKESSFFVLWRPNKVRVLTGKGLTSSSSF